MDKHDDLVKQIVAVLDSCDLHGCLKVVPDKDGQISDDAVLAKIKRLALHWWGDHI